MLTSPPLPPILDTGCWIRYNDLVSQQDRDKSCAGGDAAANFVEEPADADGELLRFGPGNQHAEVERV